MSREELLKNYILNHYRSVREFCIQINIPYSTIDNLLKKDIMQSSVSLVIRICNHLGISVDALVNGEIKEKVPDLGTLTAHERALVYAYRANTAMQSAVDKLLGVPSDSPNVGNDISSTVAAAMKKTSPKK